MIHQLGDKTVIRDGRNWIADSAKVVGNIHLKNESSVWFGAVLRGIRKNYPWRRFKCSR